MFRKINLVAGVFAVLLFAYAQHQGWSLFDNEAHAGHGHGGSGGSGRSYHK